MPPIAARRRADARARGTNQPRMSAIGAPGDLGPGLHDLARHSTADHTDESAVTLVVRQELSAVVLDDMHGIGGVGLAQALDLDVVLVTPEVRNRHRRRCIAAEE